MERHWICDPGHCWLVVPLADVEASGYRPTPFSYIASGWAYLEEDLDAPEFLKATGDPSPTLRVNVRTHWRRPERTFPE